MTRRIAVDTGEIAGIGASIAGKASALDPAARAIGGLAGVGEPAKTARALQDLELRWSPGLGRLRDDLELLGRGAMAASTLYTDTDESAMEAG